MRVAGWRYPVVLDLAGLAIPSQSRPIRFGHDPLAGVGHTDAIRIDQGQLVATGIVSRDPAAAREVVVSSKNGFPWQASVGTSVEDFEFVKEHQQVMVNGQQYSGPINVVRKATLGEISFVDLGADGATSATVAAGANTHSGDSNVDEPIRSEGTETQPGSTNTSPPIVETPAPPVTAAQPPATPPAKTAAHIREEAPPETNRNTANRKQFGGPIFGFPRVSNKLAMMAAEIMAVRQLTYFAARQKDSGQRSDLEAGMAKLIAARVAWAAADNALQIHGGNGFAMEYEISRVLADARILNIFEGAGEIQAQVIARRLLEDAN